MKRFYILFVIFFTLAGLINIATTAPVANRPPVVVTSQVSRVTLDFGGSAEIVNVSNNFSDPDGDVLFYRVRSSRPWVATASVSPTGGSVTITPRNIGSTSIVVSASDGEFSEIHVILVSVTDPSVTDEVEAPSENEAPVAAGTIAPVTILVKPVVSSVFSVPVSNNFSDPNGDTLSYTANSHDPDVVTANANGPFIEIFRVGAGSTTVTVTASDGEFTATQTISITVIAPKPGNRAPVAVGTIAVTLTEGGESEVVDVSSNFNDPDGDPLTYSLIQEYPYDANVAVVAVRNTPGIYSVIPRGVGSTAVEIEVSDGWLTATQTFSITVTASEAPVAPVGNRAPVVTSQISRVTLGFGGSVKVVNVSSNFSDPDGDVLFYTARSNGPWVATASVSVTGGSVTITPRGIGSTSIVVSASDGRLSTIHVILVSVTDPSVVVEVEESTENEAPVAVGTIAPVTRVKKPIWQVYSVGVSNNFSDPDGDTLSYTANSHDSDVVTASANGPFIEIFLVGAGSTMVTVTASDGEFTATQTISVTVTAPEVRPGNRAPVAVGTIAVTLTEGGESEVVDVSSNFNDPDGDPLTYTLIMEYPYDANVAVVSVHNTPGIYSIEPRGIGSTTVKIEVSDGEFTATQAISITVTGNQIPINGNQIPILLTALPSRIFLEINGASKVVDVSSNFSDPNGDSLVYTAVSSNTNVATVSVNGSQVRITPRRRGTDQIQAIADITVSASDGQSSVSDTIEVWVTGPLDEAPVNEVEAPSENQPPVAVGTIAPVTRVKKPIWQVYSVGVSNNFSDPDGDTLSYTANSHDSDVVTASANGPFIEIFLVGAGSTMVTVTASDGEFTATQTISVTVTAPEVRPGNRAPVAVGTIAVTLTEGGESEVVDVSSNFNDPDGDSLTYTLIMEYPYDPNVAVVAVRNTPGIYVVIPRGVGSTAVEIEVSDGWLTATQTLSITVTASEGAGANPAPTQTTVISPVTTALLPNYPNPFNPETWIPYHLAKDSNIEITIYDARGTIVRRLELGHQSAGYYTKRNRAAYWNGRNTLGEQVPSGVYFYHLQAGNVSLLRKMVILK